MSSSPSSGCDKAAEIMEEPYPIPRFDVIAEDSSDHHFANSSSSSTAKKNLPTLPPPKVSQKVQKRIAHEWRLLAENLPETILARAYENRIDLLRAAIVGAAGTPYHDGLYFFDVMFPQGYPACPPKVYYRSYGYQINPNLYYTGKVCLSLLNTWFGRNSSEKWDPNTSTALQVKHSYYNIVTRIMSCHDNIFHLGVALPTSPSSKRTALLQRTRRHGLETGSLPQEVERLQRAGFPSFL